MSDFRLNENPSSVTWIITSLLQFTDIGDLDDIVQIIETKMAIHGLI